VAIHCDRQIGHMTRPIMRLKKPFLVDAGLSLQPLPEREVCLVVPPFYRRRNGGLASAPSASDARKST
jgi:hypothetical protein